MRSRTDDQLLDPELLHRVNGGGLLSLRGETSIAVVSISRFTANYHFHS